MIAAQHIAFIMIDMQRGFIDASSPLCIEQAAQTLPACAKALEAARNAGMEVFHVHRRYDPEGYDVEPCRLEKWLRGGKPISAAWPESCEAPDELAPLYGEHVLIKPRFSCFFATDLDLRLRALGITTVVLAGTTTPNCIRSSCYDALSLGYNVAVLSDATSSRSTEVQRANLEDMQHIGAWVCSTTEFCKQGLAEMPNTKAYAHALLYGKPL